MSMAQTSDQLQQQIWATEQEILDVINQVCTDYDLRYSLAYGTLIGAVRHKGFIHQNGSGFHAELHKNQKESYNVSTGRGGTDEALPQRHIR